MSKGGSSGNTTTVQKADPWSGLQPYLKQLFGSAANIYGAGTGTAPYSGTQLAELPDWLTGSIMGGINYSQNMLPSYMDAMWGGMLPALSGTGANPFMVNSQQIGQVPESSWMSITPSMMQAAQSGWANVQPGSVNGDYALWDSLYGGVDNPFLSGMASDLVNRTQQSWGDMTDSAFRNLQQSILPGIQDDFQAAGSLGASRQALMQGNAVGQTMDALMREGGDLSTNLMGQLSNLYGTANESNENRVAQLASQLSSQGSQERLSQANLIQQALLSNAGWLQEAGLANQGMDLQAMLANQAAYGNTSQANQAAALQALLANQDVDLRAMLANQSTSLEADKLNLLSQLQAVGMLPSLAQFPMSMASQYLSAYSPILQQQQSLYDLAKNQYYEATNAPYAALLQYANILQPGYNLGGTTSTSTPSYSNPLSGVLGGLSAGYGLMDTALGYGISSAMSPLAGGLGMMGSYFLPFALLGGLLG